MRENFCRPTSPEKLSLAVRWLLPATTICPRQPLKSAHLAGTIPAMSDIAMKTVIFYIVDRKKDMIISGGFNVFSGEVEAAIMAMPQVYECAVIGVPHETWGEAVKALIVVRPGESLTEEEVIAHCKKKLGGVKAPKSVEFRAGNSEDARRENRSQKTPCSLLARSRARGALRCAGEKELGAELKCCGQNFDVPLDAVAARRGGSVRISTVRAKTITPFPCSPPHNALRTPLPVSKELLRNVDS